MPIYEYQCKVCQHELEAFQKISDEPLLECPACHKPTLQKLISAAGFQLKGTGWYATDFKDKNKRPAASNDDKSKSEGSSDKGTKTGSNDGAS